MACGWRRSHAPGRVVHSLGAADAMPFPGMGTAFAGRVVTHAIAKRGTELGVWLSLEVHHVLRLLARVPVDVQHGRRATASITDLAVTSKFALGNGKADRPEVAVAQAHAHGLVCCGVVETDALVSDALATDRVRLVARTAAMGVVSG